MLGDIAWSGRSDGSHEALLAQYRSGSCLYWRYGTFCVWIAKGGALSS